MICAGSLWKVLDNVKARLVLLNATVKRAFFLCHTEDKLMGRAGMTAKCMEK